ncbi:MAG: IS30 family transposase [Candidatus Omnitrophica bacterium]|nr:IS30 family transposase [Candidatus Omnitrophota bacterium]
MGQLNYTTNRRKYKHFTEKERYKLEGYLEVKLSAREIAKRLNKHKATVCREIKRGTILRIGYELDEYSAYRANVAQRDYQNKASNRERSLKIGKDKKLEQYIRRRIIKDKRSPDAVIGEIKQKGLKFKGMICTKTLYNYIDKGIFCGISNANLWQKRKQKKKKHKRIQRISLRNKDSRSIEERAPEINNRLEYGHWEGDCVKGARGKGKVSLFTLTERMTREQIIIKIKSALQSEIKRSMDNLEKDYNSKFNKKFKTITFDNGGEFLDWESIESSSLKKTEKRTKVYFAHPYSSWERGTNENQNRMIRRFIPKGTNIAKVSNKEIKRIEDWMNNYPRKILGYKTANELVLELTSSKKFLS